MQPPPGKKCEVRHEARFTIHGYWPQYNKDTPVPPYCDDLRCTNTKPTSANDVVGILEKSPLKKDLMKDWPNLYARQIRKEEDNLEFWKYEWRKHGMCSDDANKPSEYFRNSLTLLPNFKNLKQDLGFKPRSKVGDILKNLRDKNYKVPQIVCNSKSQLLEIRFCYRNIAIDCPNWVGNLGFKPRSKVGDILKNLRDNKYKVPQIVCNSESQLREIRFCYRNNRNKAIDCPNWVGSRTCNTKTADIILPGGAGGTDAVNYNFNHDGANYIKLV
ncbi:hypothetical protein V6Z11_D10G215600 [Gossypium hirsutum]